MSMVATFLTISEEFSYWTCRRVKYIKENVEGSEIHNVNLCLRGPSTSLPWWCQLHGSFRSKPIDLNIKLHESRINKAIRNQNFLLHIMHVLDSIVDQSCRVFYSKNNLPHFLEFITMCAPCSICNLHSKRKWNMEWNRNPQKLSCLQRQAIQGSLLCNKLTLNKPLLWKKQSLL